MGLEQPEGRREADQPPQPLARPELLAQTFLLPTEQSVPPSWLPPAQQPIQWPTNPFRTGVPQFLGQSTGLTLTEQAATAPGVCPAQPEYMAFVNDAASKAYNPERLGNLNELLHKHDCDIHTVDEAIAKANSEIGVIDHYTRVDSAEQVAQKDRNDSGSLSGIGARLHSIRTVDANAAANRSAEYRTTIDEVVPGTPAERAQLREGDYIVRVNGRDASKLGADSVADLVRGMAGTQVDLEVIRNGARIQRTLTREQLNLPLVTQPRDAGDGIAYIKVLSFGNTTAEDLRRSMERAPLARGFVIDLRDNPGGWVHQALGSAELFMRDGTVYQTRERVQGDPSNPQYERHIISVTPTGANNRLITADGQVSDTPWTRTNQYMLNDRPVIVITNGATASSAELFAGALRDNLGAEIVGTPTFGKGIGQLYSRNVAAGAAVNVTNFRYLTPSGHWPGDADRDKHPLQPDTTVANPDNILQRSAQDAQYQTAVARMRQRLGPPQQP